MKQIIQDFLNQKEIDLSAIDEATWEEILSNVPEKMLTDEILEYLISKKIALIQLAHMQLPEKWLIKLSEYDSMPMYRLAHKFYLNDEISEKDFSDFFDKYLVRYPDIIFWLFHFFEHSSKKNVLINLCINSKSMLLQEYGRDYGLAEYVKKIENPVEISKVYESNRNNPVLLKAIAGNCFTDYDLLLKLTTVQKIYEAKVIRTIARENIKKRFKG